MTEHLPTLRTPHSAALAERINEYARHARGALASNTERAYRADTLVFSTWCAERGLEPLPASPGTVAQFVDDMAESRKPATVRRYLAAISKLHNAAGIPSPTREEIVKLAVKRMNRAHGTRQDQAAPLNRDIVDKMIRAAGDRLIDLRDVALICLAYDTLARRSEITAINVEDVTFAEDDDGNGTVLIRRSKTDQEGVGDVRFLAADTIQAIKHWTETAGISEAALFRSVTKGGKVGERISDRDVSRIFKKMATRGCVEVSGISGHSTRVGPAQDMAAAGLGLTEIMQSGGWKSPVMVGRYTERLMARRGAAAKLAVLQGRATLKSPRP
jgi:integrase